MYDSRMIESFLPRWRASVKRTHDMIESARAVDTAFRVSEKTRSLHDQIAHVFATRESVLHALTGGEFNWKSDYADYKARSIDEMLTVAAEIDSELQRVVEMDDEMWLAQVVPPLPRSEWLWALLEHETHHVGQIAMTIRLAGGAPAKIFE